MRQVPIKNYVIAIVLIVLTVCVSLYVSKMYKVSNKIDNEISFANLENYLYENPNVIIYLKNDSYLKFENNFEKVIYDHSLNSQVISVDLSLLNSEDRKNFYNKYCSELIDFNNLFSVPNIILVKDGKVSAVYASNYSDVSGDNITSFLGNNGWLND